MHFSNHNDFKLLKLIKITFFINYWVKMRIKFSLKTFFSKKRKSNFQKRKFVKFLYQTINKVINFDFNSVVRNFLDDFSFRLFTDGFHFFDARNKFSDIPLILVERNQSVLWIALFGLSISFILIAFSRFGSSNFVVVFSKILYKNNNINKIIQDEYSLFSMGSIFLLLNYLISTSTLLYLANFSFSYVKEINIFIFLPLLPIYFLLWPLICYNIVGFLTGEKETFGENKKNVIVLSQLVGILFSLLLLLWTFNLKWSIYFIYAFIILMSFFWIYKIFRGIIFSFQHNVSWYYIILYFCTLEILPIFIFYMIFIVK